MIAWVNRWQIPVYIGAMMAGAVIGLLAPWSSAFLEVLVTPALMVLLFATFLAVPFATIGRALKDVRFLGAVLVLNFLLVPVLVFGLSRFVTHDRALLVGVLLVLLTPCIDYVVVFTRLAGGEASRLLAVSPVLMLAQLALLPVYLGLFAGPAILDTVEIEPFVVAFLLFIALPMGLAAVMQTAARRFRAARVVERTMDAAMVPLLALTLAVIFGAQIETVRAHAGALLPVVPLYVVFLVVAPMLAILVARVFRQDAATSRATVFSGATRNSLVVLPLALALPEPLSLAAAAIVTQTLVELVGMVVLVQVVPRLVRRDVSAQF
ncbi:arsenic resistance protein [Microbacterium sp. RURRCA19A]|uniref:arsenic resistance protein n=1 Tax=Microbacterium sp. RURRCA19A TaxID=1907391 RepID=UPI000954CC47|nr:arsenic resistance protein [Microbacterium sp. RURRCA19A]SIR52092.1 Arsenite efflux pump ArsB, ACR3 family [Microbacterium sp. RURRCA19A]